MNRDEYMERLVACIMCVAVALAFLSGSVSLGYSARDVSHAGCSSAIHDSSAQQAGLDAPPFALADVPEYAGEFSVEINGGVPFFTDVQRSEWRAILSEADGRFQTDEVGGNAHDDAEWADIEEDEAYGFPDDEADGGYGDGSEADGSYDYYDEAEDADETEGGAFDAYANAVGVAAFPESDDTFFERYSELDRRGRCGTALALVGRETMPVVRREGIGMVRPSGWQIARYPWVDGEYLFNRCHLIGYQLAGENANARNLITGTRSMNVLGMLPYEDEAAYYVRRTGNHVLYRVTPLFEGRNLVASGVLMEAESLEDGGDDLQFCVWCYNVEPGVAIDYRTGESHADGTMGDDAGQAVSTDANDSVENGVSAITGDDENEGGNGHVRQSPVEIDPDATFVLNSSTLKFHRPDCPSVSEMAESHRQFLYCTSEEAIDEGYIPCGWCKPDRP